VPDFLYQPEETAAMLMGSHRRSFQPEPASSLRKDFRIFLAPGFWGALALIGLLSSAAAGILLHANMKDGISPVGW
jgi:hypothetical protein